MPLHLKQRFQSYIGPYQFIASAAPCSHFPVLSPVAHLTFLRVRPSFQTRCSVPNLSSGPSFREMVSSIR
jgi:hypothetical protein